MSQEKMYQELGRQLDTLEGLEPGSKEYKAVLEDFQKLYNVFINDDKMCEAQLARKHKEELERRKLELEERKMDLDEKKFEFDRRQSEKRNELDSERLALDEQKFDYEQEQDVRKAAQEDRKLDIEEQDVRCRTHMTKRQALGRLLEIGAHGVVTIACIVVTGKLEESTILSSKMWSLIGKPKI